jgi:hypothetical protein
MPFHSFNATFAYQLLSILISPVLLGLLWVLQKNVSHNCCGSYALTIAHLSSAVKPQLKLSKRASWIVSVFYPYFSI